MRTKHEEDGRKGDVLGVFVTPRTLGRLGHGHTQPGS